jgi:hypothetical protein
MLHKDAILQINFGYTQLLFMGSVPRINCHLAIFLLHIPVNDSKVLHTKT